MTEGLNVISKKIFEANKAKGFWDKERNIGEMLMLVVTELAEALEAHRGRGNSFSKQLFESGCTVPGIGFKKSFETYVKDSFEDEIADAMIRLFDMAGGLNIDLDFHIKNKLEYNATRAKLHGKKY